LHASILAHQLVYLPLNLRHLIRRRFGSEQLEASLRLGVEPELQLTLTPQQRRVDAVSDVCASLGQRFE
jgi:hypothetical protein